MASRWREAVAPAYLFLCLVLGGSGQGIWANMALQLLGVAILAWAAIDRDPRPLDPTARQLLILATVAIAWIAIQLVPLPPELWTRLGGRAVIADGYRTLGLPAPWLPLSLTPERSIESLLGLIPPLAMFCAVTRFGAYRPLLLALALLAAAFAGVVLGALQVSGPAAGSPWYLYPESSFGLATGFFANANHMAILLVATLPFLTALLASSRGADRQRASGATVAVAAAALLVLGGIAINHSLAGFGLTVPVLVASGLMLMPQRSRWRSWMLGVSGLLAIVAVAALGASSVRGGQFASDAATSVLSRQQMLSTTAAAIGDFMPWGSGLGSFRGVYQLYEDPAAVTDVYAIHAHDDYVEVALELGAPGILLMLAFLGWWAKAVWRAWIAPEPQPFARAAAIASAAILLHSIVDFPLRTAAIAALFATCLAMLVERRAAAAVRFPGDLRPTRHIVIR